MLQEQLETKLALLQDLGLENFSNAAVDVLIMGDSRYLKDMRMNLSAFLRSQDINKKEFYLLALAIANNNGNELLQKAFSEKAKLEGSNDSEVADALACVSIMSANNVLYRFRHFMHKESYDQMRAGMRMQIMQNPVLGKEFFELVSLAVSAVNGCELCVKAHEEAVLKLGTTETRIFEAVKIASVVTSVCKVVY
jgi:lipoyl-dependent peroxiredoxin subunit D